MMNSKVWIVLALLCVVVLAFAINPFGGRGGAQSEQRPKEETALHSLPEGMKDLVVAGGCFWCLDSLFENVKGVQNVEACYVGGSRTGVSYEEVSSGETGDAESVRIVYDPLRLFFVSHHPTTLNYQGPDHGTQYRSAIFFRSPEEKALAVKIRDEIAKQKVWDDPIVTTIEPFKNYTRAEEYHQHYYQKYLNATPAQRATMNGGYCAAIIQPHVLEFKKRFAKYLKN